MVVLQNGESLSGTFSRIRKNTLVFRTSLQGQMMTPMSEVRSLSANKPLCITMTDGQVYYGHLAVENKVQQVLPLNENVSITIEVKDIQETLPIPTSPVASDNKETWELSGGPGVQWRSDSHVPAEPTVQLNTTGWDAAWHLDAAAIIERADSDQFPTYLRAQGELFGKSDRSINPFVSAAVERDLYRNLELRQNLALGLYHSVYGTKDTSADILFGFDFEYEREQNEPGNYDLNLQLGLHYYRRFTQRHSLSESLTILPSMTAMEDLRARAETIYTLPLTNKLHLRLELIVGYDNTPLTNDVNRWNATVGAGVHVTF
ncbi:MAG: DUF481 domain-containing protein [Candidatus Hydrogenedentes bacterium]|nr:DUF481 domain-containing protein [Candidatus Hydrogenedentota bacterium]